MQDLGELYKFLTQLEWSPGEPRLTGTIMIFVEDGRFKCWLHDRDAHLSGWVSAPSFPEVLLAADRLVVDQAGEWRPDRANNRPVRRG